MKLAQLVESIDFVPSFFNKEKGWNESPFKDGVRDCSACEGTGKDNPNDPDNKYPCMYCEETPGKEKYSEYDVPHMNVSNANAALILQMIGKYSSDEDGTVGIIKNKEIPEIKRKLLILKNKEDEAHTYTKPSEETKGKKTSYIDKTGGTPEIKTRGGATMIDMGVNIDQVRRYIDRLLEILSYAQSKGWDVSWH